MLSEKEHHAQHRACLLLEQVERRHGADYGVELLCRCDRGVCGAVVVRSTKKSGWWQLTFFDENGFLGDSQFPSALDAVEEAVLNGCTALHSGLLEWAIRRPTFRGCDPGVSALALAQGEAS